MKRKHALQSYAFVNLLNSDCSAALLFQNCVSYTPTTFTSIAAGAGHCVALDSNGHVWTWGKCHFGQLGTLYACFPVEFRTKPGFPKIC